MAVPAPVFYNILWERGRGMTENGTRPQGEPAIRTLAMPADTNPNGDIFGGWIMSQMDIAGGIPAVKRAKGRIATVANAFVDPGTMVFASSDQRTEGLRSQQIRDARELTKMTTQETGR